MKQRTGYPVIDEILDSIAPPETYDRKAQPLVLDDRKQNFAGVATIRAAIFDVLDAEEFYFEWNVLSEDDQNQERERFAAKVIDRISDLQSREGIKLENLCPRHKVERRRSKKSPPSASWPTGRSKKVITFSSTKSRISTR